MISEMGVYDRKVREKLGDTVLDLILDNVNQGIIDAQKMKDFAHKLSGSTFGKHKLRTERGNCDEAEMREILSDWYNEEMYKIDSKAALDKIIGILLLR